MLSRRYFGGGLVRSDWTAAHWRRATGAALAERLAPALGEACATEGVDVPGESWALLAAARLENERRTEAQELVLRELGAAFEEAGVRPVLFKGLALARHYPARAARAIGDIDLLVVPGELPRAGEVLQAAGYEHWGGGGRLSARYPLTYGRFTHGDDEETVDLHPAWHEVTVDAGGDDVVVGDVREPLEWGEVGGSIWATLPPAVELYVTAAHAVLHSLRTLSLYLDLAVQVAKAGAATTEKASKLARSQGRDRHLRHAVTAAAELFGLEVESRHLTVPRRLGVPVALRLGYTGAGFRLLPSSLVMELAMRRGLRRRLDFARWVLGHGGRGKASGKSGRPAARLLSIVRGFRWFKGTVLRYRTPGSSPLRS
ncbi:MAG: hypothetical protein GTN75_01010 [Gemmatimonadetes bacterium]|nr:hypothetical protein [Gemmatimonadota bacterium]